MGGFELVAEVARRAAVAVCSNPVSASRSGVVIVEDLSMARPPKHPVDVKLKIVLSVVSGESSQAGAGRRHGVSETSIGNWRDQFLAAGRQGLERGERASKPSGREVQLLGEVDDLTRALGEAHVELRALKRGGASVMGFRR